MITRVRGLSQVFVFRQAQRSNLNVRLALEV
jgi:hypothetical protein